METNLLNLKYFGVPMQDNNGGRYSNATGNLATLQKNVADAQSTIDNLTTELANLNLEKQALARILAGYTQYCRNTNNPDVGMNAWGTIDPADIALTGVWANSCSDFAGVVTTTQKNKLAYAFGVVPGMLGLFGSKKTTTVNPSLSAYDNVSAAVNNRINTINNTDLPAARLALATAQDTYNKAATIAATTDPNVIAANAAATASAATTNLKTYFFVGGGLLLGGVIITLVVRALKKHPVTPAA